MPRVKTKPNVDVGVTFTNNDGLSFEVQEIVEIKKYEKMCKITFNESGYTTIVGSSSITKGTVKDYYQKSVLGIACLGDYKQNSKHTKQTYQLWQNMIYRCYNENNKDYHEYGALGVKVCTEWLCYNNFLNDLYDIDNFDLELFENKKLVMDKDKKQENIPKSKRVYSKNTCCFISVGENSSIRNTENSLNPNSKNIKITYLEDGTTEILNRKDLKSYCDENGLNPDNVRRVLRKERKSYKNTTFEFVD